MHVIDWLIVALPIAVVVGVALYTRRYLRSVADFLAGGRNAGRFLLCVALGEMGAGAVAVVSNFEMFGQAGFTLTWWNQISVLVGVLVAISGFVIYRYRQTRALTLAQFFEMRYSRRFRLFAGLLGVFAGLLNFGIIPVIGARFMVNFFGLPHYIFFPFLQIPTDLVLMACFLIICIVLTTAGGQITVIVTDSLQGLFSQIAFVIIATVLLLTFSWPQTREVLLARPPGYSMVNPFNSLKVKDFNIWYVLMTQFFFVYRTMAWQNSQGFNSSAITPHESRMGSVLGGWRLFAQTAMMGLLGVCALTYLGQAAGSVNVQHVLDKITDPQTAKQMRYPIALSQLLPVGIKGLLVSTVLMGIFSGDGMQLHSWSGILIQDVILPLRKIPLTTRQHLILLRSAIVGVAIFVFCFGALFHQNQYVAMWFVITEGIFVAGAGACIIGGLYWSRGTTAGAWTGVLTGFALSVTGIVLQQIYPSFPLNGRQVEFFAALVAVTGYVVVSLLTCRTPHDMDRLLHRGKCAVEPEALGELISTASKPEKNRFRLSKLVGIDEHFSCTDRWITIGIFAWSVTWFLVLVIGSICHFIHPWSDTTWANYWLVTAIYLPLLIGVVTTIWFTISCFHDMRVFFHRLREERVDPRDDGTVNRSRDVDDAVHRPQQPQPVQPKAAATSPGGGDT
jgi:SSS family solute:Na+ symporter